MAGAKAAAISSVDWGFVSTGLLCLLSSIRVQYPMRGRGSRDLKLVFFFFFSNMFGEYQKAPLE